MIYCVIPREWAGDLYDQMAAYYADNPNVTVILDRRAGADRRSGDGGEPMRRELRDRRRARVVGTFPTTDTASD